MMINTIGKKRVKIGFYVPLTACYTSPPCETCSSRHQLGIVEITKMQKEASRALSVESSVFCH